jgi:hypothetical protein
MISLEDFTTLAEGAEVAVEGRVGRCPKCGRAGVEKLGDEATSFVHVQTCEVLGDGMLTVPRDRCLVPKVLDSRGRTPRRPAAF